MTLSRRSFLVVTGAGAAGLTLAGCGASLSGQTAELLASQLPLPSPFRELLPVPPVKWPVRTHAGTDYYEIVARAATAQLLPGVSTPIFGYDGIFPGPTIETRRGRRTIVRHVNKLPVPTVAHLHGGHTPAASDGYPTDLVLPRPGRPLDHGGHADMVGNVATGSRDHDYPMNQRAATLWYHDHRMDFTGPAVYRGLAGFHLVRDDDEDALALPRGERELPLMIADRAFAADGSLRYPSLDPQLCAPPGVAPDYMEGVLGDVILVNGAPWPVAEVDATRYRLRLLNASNARRYRLTLHPTTPDGMPFVQIGSDGGLLARPVRHAALQVVPGERFDVIVDFSAYPVGTEVTMLNEWGSGSTAQVMRFRVARRAADDTAVPERLSVVEALDPATATVRRDWRFHRGEVRGHAGWLINDRPFEPAVPHATSHLGDVELWRFVSDLHHPVHVHLDPFQVLSRGDEGPGPFDAGWKDTVDLPPGEIVQVAIRFTEYPGRFVMHCHNLEHEDMAMMAAVETS